MINDLRQSVSRIRYQFVYSRIYFPFCLLLFLIEYHTYYVSDEVFFVTFLKSTRSLIFFTKYKQLRLITLYFFSFVYAQIEKYSSASQKKKNETLWNYDNAYTERSIARLGIRRHQRYCCFFFGGGDQLSLRTNEKLIFYKKKKKICDNTCQKMRIIFISGREKSVLIFYDIWKHRISS